MNTVAPFSIGSSTLPNAASAPGLHVDMSLDDLIKARRQQAAMQKKNAEASTGTGGNIGKNKRVNLKAQTAAGKQQQKPSNVQKSIGSNKAKRGAKISSKRGVSDTSKATPMQIEREVYRQTRTGGSKNESEVAPRRSRRNRNKQNSANEQQGSGGGRSSNKSIADQKMKQKNIARQKKQGQQQQQQQQQQVNKIKGNEEVVKPPRKVIGVAKKAMKDAGFIPPKGMKMVVSFVAPEKNDSGAKNANGNNTGRLKTTAIRQNQNDQKQQKNSENRGGNRKGRWLKRNGNKMED
mmetsp:Transcript_7008/g.13214  ORF Transcript_7008/g.13214 Transcript_7008/m.13214 type:complete len:293 (-) Transcript_7008:703-1581(-)|eukprot:CAMPEP_0176494082 /NCGR_PEP_ID=MMETSP0200_2-20121128/9895_1 /TAXON_ID=947934 /ORGANISM="Chaetoceros sp., Strain GSL56" /LENGTH=292 /DNA_ID=CAMNT_0017891793 /DNA_START=114 /DNA_END=992 /DNA_ORIENTATION=-